MTIKENMASAKNKGEWCGLRLWIKKSNASRYKEIIKTLELGIEKQLNTT